MIETPSLQEARADKDKWAPLIRKAANNKRNESIALAILNGAKYSEAAEAHGVSRDRARQIFMKSLRIGASIHRATLGKETHWPSVRIENSLASVGIRSKEDALLMWDLHGPKYFSKLPNFGRKSLAELANFLGVTVPVKTGIGDRTISRSRYEQAKRIVERYEEQNAP